MTYPLGAKKVVAGDRPRPAPEHCVNFLRMKRSKHIIIISLVAMILSLAWAGYSSLRHVDGKTFIAKAGKII